MKPLYKTTIVIWSEQNPREIELEDLAREATSGDCYCSSSEVKYIVDPPSDPDWDSTEFFDEPGDEE